MEHLLHEALPYHSKVKRINVPIPYSLPVFGEAAGVISIARIERSPLFHLLP